MGRDGERKVRSQIRDAGILKRSHEPQRENISPTLRGDATFLVQKIPMRPPRLEAVESCLEASIMEHCV